MKRCLLGYRTHLMRGYFFYPDDVVVICALTHLVYQVPDGCDGLAPLAEEFPNIAPGSLYRDVGLVSLCTFKHIQGGFICHNRACDALNQVSHNALRTMALGVVSRGPGAAFLIH